MKNLIACVITIVCIGLATGVYAQNNSDTTTADTTTTTASEKSTTVSALCTAKAEVIAEILSELYASDGKIDVVKEFEIRMKPRIAECLKIDMIETGIKVRDNALVGKFKKVKLSFEKPSDNTFKVSGKEKRTYKRAYKHFKKSFVEDRKGKPLKEVLGNKNLQKKSDKVTKVMTRRFKKDIRKISK